MSIKLAVALLAVVLCQQALATSLSPYFRLCYVRRVRYATYSPRGSILLPGKSVTYKCNNGYELQGSATVKCGPFGFTTAFPKCVRITGCRPPARNLFPKGMSYKPVQKSYKQGAKLWLTCADGYTLKVRHPSYETIRCFAGKWSPIRATCQREIFCPTPANPENGFIKGKAPFVPGSKVWVICNAGFVASGKKDFVCKSNGQWNGEFPTCDPIVKCDSLGEIENGSFSPKAARYDVGATVTYECDDFFDLDGQSVLTCQDSGEFDAEKPSCIAQVCEVPIAPENGFVDPADLDEYPVTTPITFGCNLGFELVGTADIVCEEGGQWSNEFPTCQEIFCDAIQIDNGFFSPDQDQFVVGEDATYECDPGFELDGDATITCQANGEFDPQPPTCIPVRCAFPGDIDNGSPDSEEDFYDVGETVEYTCDDGFDLDGDAVLTCQNDGEFTPELPTCIERVCDEPETPENGFFRDIQDSYPVGTTITYYCSKGFQLDGERELTCQAGGVWSADFPTCERLTCPAPVVPENGRIKGARDFYIPGNKIWFFCDHPFDLKGKKDLRCQDDGTWNAPFPTCEQTTCPEPVEPDNGGIKGERDIYVPGNKIWFFCAKTHNLVGKKDLQCQSNGQWNGRFPTCVPRAPTCPKPVKPRNGDIKGEKKVYESGDKIWFSCDKNYDLKGKKDLRCQDDGTWNAPFPTCERSTSCGRPPRVSYASFRPYKRSYSVGAKVEYRCRRGYILIGEDDIKCGSNGKWNPLGQQCINSYSCRNRCGKFVKGAACQCNTKCKIFRNCCRDFASRCH